MNFGERIRKYRLMRGLSQKELAKRMNISQQAIAKFEKTNIQPKLSTARNFAEALGVTVGDLVTDWTYFSHKEIVMDWAEPSKNELLKHYQKLNTQGKRKVVDYAEDLTKIPEYQDQHKEQKESLPDHREGNDGKTE